MPRDAWTPPCAICRQRAASIILRFLTHGVGVWLCTAHGNTAFMRREGGRELVRRLTGIWSASDALGLRRRAALAAHIERLRLANDGRDKPGSHTWPKLRREAEQRFAAGETPALVIDELRRNYDDGPAIVPSIRTMRRWFAQGRWMVSPVQIGLRRPRALPPDPEGSDEPNHAAPTSDKSTPRRE